MKSDQGKQARERQIARVKINEKLKARIDDSHLSDCSSMFLMFTITLNGNVAGLILKYGGTCIIHIRSRSTYA